MIKYDDKKNITKFLNTIQNDSDTLKFPTNDNLLFGD